MALIFFDGFDYSTNGAQIASRYDDSRGVGSSGTTPFGSGRAVNVGGGTSSGFLQRNLAGAITSIVVGIAVDLVRLDATIFTFVGTAGLFGTLKVNASGFVVYNNGSADVAISSGHAAFAPGEYRYIEAQIVFSDVAGAVTIQVDGTVVADVSGADTVFGTMGAQTLASVQVNGFDPGHSYDDFYICDTTGPAPWNDFLGPVRVQTFMPSADSAVQFTRSAGTTNASCVDEIGANDDGDYVESSTAGQKDYYQTAANVSGTVFGVQATLRAKKTDTGARSIIPRLKSGAAEAASAQATLQVSYLPFTLTCPTDPATDAQWDATAANGVLIGHEVQ